MAVKMGVDLPDVMFVPSLKGAVGGRGGRENSADHCCVSASLVLVVSQLRGEELVLLLSDHGQLLPGLIQLPFFS